MLIIDNTKEVKKEFSVGDLVKSRDGNVFVITRDPNYKYYLVALGDGSMSDACESIDDLFEEGYLDETDKKVSGFLTIKNEEE